MPFKKNTAVTGFTVGLVSATDGSDITTGTPVGYYTLDGGTQTAIADTSPVHEGNGLWSFDLTTSEMNGDIVALTFTHTSAVSAHFTIKTETVLTSDLNDFDAANDAVANVTLVATTTTNTDVTALNDFDPVNDTVATVTDVTNQVSADVTAISGDSTAADNAELMYDGTGYTDGTAPSSRDQVATLTSGSAAISVIADSFVASGAEGETNTYTATESLDGVVHTVTPDATTTDCYYEFSVGANGRPVNITWNGYANNNGSSYAVYGYDYGATSYKQIGSIDGSQGSVISEQSFSLTTSHVGTGADLGKVRFRFVSTDGISIATDRVLCSYAVVYQSSGYALGAIWVDTNESNTGTVDYVDGVADNPVSTWAAALTLSASLGIKKFQVASGSAITLTASTDYFDINAYGVTITLNGQSVSGTQISGATISGSDDGTNTVATAYIDCIMATHTLGLHSLKQSKLTGNITLAEAGDYIWDYCSSFVAGSGTPDVTYSASVNLSMRHYSGGIEINSMSATNKMSLEGMGQLKIAATCTGGAVSIRGAIAPITDAAGAAVTLTENARLGDDTINTQVDLAISDANLATAASIVALNNFDYTSETVSADITAISGSSTAADNLEESATAIVLGLAETGTLSTTEMTTDLTVSVAGQFIGRTLIFRGDTTTPALRNQATDITGVDVSGGKLTFTALTTAPSNGDSFVIV